MSLLTKIKSTVDPILASQQIDLVDIELKGKVGSQVLRIFVDIEGGISLQQCAQLSHEISDVLDTNDLIPGRYRLEVSSPGLDRRLKTERDFKRNLGRKARINYYINPDKADTITGTINQVDNKLVVIDQNDLQVKINLNDILVAKIIPVW